MGSRTLTFGASGTLANQRNCYINAPTFASSSGNTTLTLVSGLEVESPVAGTSVTIVNKYAINAKGNLGGTHIVGNSTAPTIASGAGLGTGAGTVVSLTRATDLSGIIGVVTGTASLGTSAVLATVTFNSAYGAAPNIIIQALDAGTGNLQATPGLVITATTTSATAVLNTNTVALTASSTYSFYYHIVQ